MCKCPVESIQLHNLLLITFEIFLMFVNLQGKITAQGKLLLHGLLNCWEGLGSATLIGGRGKELQVFLFEQNIIFSDAVGKKTAFTSPVYIYKNHIPVSSFHHIIIT